MAKERRLRKVPSVKSKAVHIKIEHEQHATHNPTVESPDDHPNNGTKKTADQVHDKCKINLTSDRDGLSCSHCQKVFKTKLGLYYHSEKKVCHRKSVNKEKELPIFRCSICGKKFDTELLMLHHIDKEKCNPDPPKMRHCQELGHENSSLSCSVCSKSFKTKRSLKCHQEKKVCQVISHEERMRLSSVSIKKSKNKHHQTHEFLDNCPRKGKKNKPNEIHDDSKTKPSPRKEIFFCSNCQKVFKTNVGLKYHLEKQVCNSKPIKEEKESPMLRCSICSKAFDTELLMQHHIDSNQCNPDPPKTNQNQKLDHEISILSCFFCSKSFKTKRALKYHVDKKVCQPCSLKRKELSSSNGTKSDRCTRRRTGELLDIHPKKEATSQAIQIRDEFTSLTNAGDKYFCTFCEKVFETDLGLKHHLETQLCHCKVLKVEEISSLFRCSVCDETFDTESLMEHHIDHKLCNSDTPKTNRNQRIVPECSLSMCSFCSKSFKTEKMLRHHLDKKVCKTRSSKEKTHLTENLTLSDHEIEPSSSKSSDSDDDEDGDFTMETASDDEALGEAMKKHPLKEKGGEIESQKSIQVQQYTRVEYFRQLLPGSLHITRFGVVEVIADCRLPSNYVVTKHSRSIHKDVLRFTRIKDSFDCKHKTLAEHHYLGGRIRREKLKEMYLATLHPEGESPVITQSDVWGMYCESVKPSHILKEEMSWRHLNRDIRQDYEIETFSLNDPRYPNKFYPDRIVECKLVADNRKVVCSNSSMTECDEGESKHIACRENVVSIRLFLKRRELKEQYVESDTKYICSLCRESFSKMGKWKNHVDQKDCLTEKLAAKEAGVQRVQVRDNEALNTEKEISSFLSYLHGVTSPKSSIAEFGNPCKIKQHKKHKMPSWIVFNDRRTSIYPELFISLQFKRGSQNRKWAAQKKLRHGYVPHFDRKRLEKKKRRTIRGLIKSDKLLTPNLAHSASVRCSEAIKVYSGNRNRIPDQVYHEVSLQGDSNADNRDGALPHLSILYDSLEINGNKKKDKEKKEEKKQMSGEINFQSHNLLTQNLDNRMSVSIGEIIREHDENSDRITDQEGLKASLQVDSHVINGESVAESLHLFQEHHSVELNEEEKKLKGIMGLSSERVGGTTQKNNEVAKLNSIRTSSILEDVRDHPRIHDQMNTVDCEINGESMVVHKRRAKPIIIDTQVLASECIGGRYPLMNRFDGVHQQQCVVCDTAATSSENPLFECDFCKNSAHQSCICRRLLNKDPPVILRENEPDDSLMCHDCISWCLARRSRAENRRLAKWQYELSLVGLNCPSAANLEVEVDFKGADESNNDLDEEKEDHEYSYAPCPNGGAGGLICCSYCTAVYSRYLSNTAKEMEAQSVAKAGQEVNEILDILTDAKNRLQKAVSINQMNELRRGLIRKNEI